MAEDFHAKREQLLFKAKLSEQAERYDEMVVSMKAVAQMPQELTVEERNLMSVAYKNAANSRRSSWRIMSALEQKESERGNQERVTQAAEYKMKVEQELKKVCEEVLSLIDHHLIKGAVTSESKVFYHKMKGDYSRYLAEIADEDHKKVSAEKACKAYEEAMVVSKKELKPTNPICLGLILNFSVFYYEILKNSEKACAMAQKAFDAAILELDEVKEETYKDSTLIMQLLRDNLTLWTSENEQLPAQQCLVAKTE